MKYIIYLFVALLMGCTATDDNGALVQISENDNFLSGTIKNENGELIKGATVVLYSTEQATALTKKINTHTFGDIVDSVSATDGNFKFLLNIEGTYSIRAFLHDSIVAEKEDFMYQFNLSINLLAIFRTNHPDNDHLGEMIIFDNFENGAVAISGNTSNDNNQTDLGAFFNTDNYDKSGRWYVYNEYVYGGKSRAKPDYAIDTDFSEGLATSGYNSSSSMHLTITHYDDVEYPYYGVGAPLREYGQYFDLSSMDSITFYTKGSGSMKLIMKTEEADVDFKSDWGVYQALFDLDSMWKKVTFTAKDFIGSKYSDLEKTGAGFENGANKSVEGLYFETHLTNAGEIVDFWLDDIVIQGLSYNDLITPVTEIPYTPEYDPDTTAGRLPLPITEPSEPSTNPVDSSYIVKELSEEDINLTGMSFDDFENRAISTTDSMNYNWQTDIGAYFNNGTTNSIGKWYAENENEPENPDEINSIATPNYIIDTNFTSGLEQSGNNGSSQCLYLQVNLGTTLEIPTYYIGAPFTKRGEYFDMTKLEAIAFYAKGSGKLRVSLKTKVEKEEQVNFKNDWGNYGHNFILTDEWRKIVVRPNDFTAWDYSDLEKHQEYYTFDAYKAVEGIYFNTMEGTPNDIYELWIDDIIMAGVEYEDFRTAVE